MPKKTGASGSGEPPALQAPERQRKQRLTSPYFREPTTSPHFDRTFKSSRSAPRRSRTVVQESIQVEDPSGAVVKRRSSGKMFVVKAEDQNVLVTSSSTTHRPPRKKQLSSGNVNPAVPSPILSPIPSVRGLRLVLRNTHSDRTVPMVLRLLHTKPLLLQGLLFHKPWWLLIAVILLNKTTGKAATPVLYKIMSRWPTMEELSRACVPELQELLTPLGLASVRTQRLILFANMYLNDPPCQNNLRPSRVQVAKGEPKYPPTAVSHLPGMGRYALDSYRIFCCKLVGENDWKTVQPLDKELRVAVRWRWAVLGFVWDCEKGVIGPATECYLNDLCEGQLNPTCKAPDYISKQE